MNLETMTSCTLYNVHNSRTQTRVECYLISARGIFVANSIRVTTCGNAALNTGTRHANATDKSANAALILSLILVNPIQKAFG